MHGENSLGFLIGRSDNLVRVVVMEGQGAFHVLFVTGTAALDVEYDAVMYARVAHADGEVEAGVKGRWDAARKKNSTLFNASKFRYAGLKVADGVARILVGITDYATFVGTHGVNEPRLLFGLQSMAMPLGNAIVVTTSDGKVAFLRRSRNVGEGVGRVVFPGGHPEPDMVKVMRSDEVRKELWEAAKRETVEELFLEENQTDDLRCLGLVERSHDAKVCQIFSMCVKATALQINLQYQSLNVDEEESDQLLFKELHELIHIREKGAVDGLLLMPEHLGALHLWLLDRATKE